MEFGPLRSKSSFSADRTHYHHPLLDDRSLPANQTLVVALISQFHFILVAWGFHNLNVAEFVE